MSGKAYLSRQLTQLREKQRCAFFVLVDPDKASTEYLKEVSQARVLAFLVGGSELTTGNIEATCTELKKHTDLPIYLFPGDTSQFFAMADGILLPSLISGRNPEYLIGQHVKSSIVIENSGMDVFSTGYILLDGGSSTSTQKVTQTLPISFKETEQILATALAGQQLGLGSIYLEAGSGCREHVPTELISTIVRSVSVPVLVGGGIRRPDDAAAIKQAGATAFVVGNILEKEPDLIHAFNEIADA